MNIHIHVARAILQDGLGLGPGPFWTVGHGIGAFFELGRGPRPLFESRTWDLGCLEGGL